MEPRSKLARKPTQLGSCRLLSVSEAAGTLAVSVRTVRRLIQRGDLIAHRIGRVVRVLADELTSSLERRRTGVSRPGGLPTDVPVRPGTLDAGLGTHRQSRRRPRISHVRDRQARGTRVDQPFRSEDIKELKLREADRPGNTTSLSPENVAAVVATCRELLSAGHASLIALIAGSGPSIDEAPGLRPRLLRKFQPQRLSPSFIPERW